MSRINCVRSSTRQGKAASRLRSCVGDKSWSKRTRSAWVEAAMPAISSTLPEPMSVAGSGLGGAAEVLQRPGRRRSKSSSRNSARDSSAPRSADSPAWLFEACIRDFAPRAPSEGPRGKRGEQILGTPRPYLRSAHPCVSRARANTELHPYQNRARSPAQGSDPTVGVEACSIRRRFDARACEGPEPPRRLPICEASPFNRRRPYAIAGPQLPVISKRQGTGDGPIPVETEAGRCSL